MVIQVTKNITSKDTNKENILPEFQQILHETQLSIEDSSLTVHQLQSEDKVVSHVIQVSAVARSVQ